MTFGKQFDNIEFVKANLTKNKRRYVILSKKSRKKKRVSIRYEYDYTLLRERIKQVFGTYVAFAKAMDLDVSSLSGKLSNRISWSSSDIIDACELLSIPSYFVTLYFFNAKVKQGLNFNDTVQNFKKIS